MTLSSFLIRSPHSADELTDHLQGYVEVAQSFSPDPLPEDTAPRLLRRLITLPGYRQEQVRSAYRNGELLGGYRISERLLRVGAARLPTGCIGGVYTRAEARKQGVATALMHDAMVLRRLMSMPCCCSMVFQIFITAMATAMCMTCPRSSLIVKPF